MSHLLWLHFGWDTSIRDIGWTWVILAGLIGWLIYLSWTLWRNW